MYHFSSPIFGIGLLLVMTSGQTGGSECRSRTVDSSSESPLPAWDNPIIVQLPAGIKLDILSRGARNRDYIFSFEKAATAVLIEMGMIYLELKREVLQMPRRMQKTVSKLTGVMESEFKDRVTKGFVIPAALEEDMFADLIDSYNRKRADLLARIEGIKSEVCYNFLRFRRALRREGCIVLKTGMETLKLREFEDAASTSTRNDAPGENSIAPTRELWVRRSRTEERLGDPDSEGSIEQFSWVYE